MLLSLLLSAFLALIALLKSSAEFTLWSTFLAAFGGFAFRECDASLLDGCFGFFYAYCTFGIEGRVHFMMHTFLAGAWEVRFSRVWCLFTWWLFRLFFSFSFLFLFFSFSFPLGSVHSWNQVLSSIYDPHFTSGVWGFVLRGLMLDCFMAFFIAVVLKKFNTHSLYRLYKLYTLSVNTFGPRTLVIQFFSLVYRCNFLHVINAYIMYYLSFFFIYILGDKLGVYLLCLTKGKGRRYGRSIRYWYTADWLEYISYLLTVNYSQGYDGSYYI